MSADPSEQAERRAIRRRWINVGEIVAVAGLIVAALSLYLGWSGRREDEAERQADRAAFGLLGRTVSQNSSMIWSRRGATECQLRRSHSPMSSQSLLPRSRRMPIQPSPK